MSFTFTHVVTTPFMEWLLQDLGSFPMFITLKSFHLENIETTHNYYSYFAEGESEVCCSSA